MKPHYNPLATALAVTLQFAVLAAVPLAWDVRPGQPAPVTFDRYHGEALEFSATFRGFGELPFAPSADIRLWFQTNGMGSAWWSVPATVQSNVLSATWSPALDPGADRVSLFFGAPSNAYAAAVLRLRHSPGFAPGSLPDPIAFHESDPEFTAWLSTYTPPDTSLEPATNYTDAVAQSILMDANRTSFVKDDGTVYHWVTNGIWSTVHGQEDDPEKPWESGYMSGARLYFWKTTAQDGFPAVSKWTWYVRGGFGSPSRTIEAGADAAVLRFTYPKGVTNVFVRGGALLRAEDVGVMVAERTAAVAKGIPLAVANFPGSNVVVGVNNVIESNSVIVAGYNNTVTGQNAMAFGFDSTSGGDGSVSVGGNASALADNSSAFGSWSSAKGIQSIAIGPAAESTNINSVAIGTFSKSYGVDSIAIGEFAAASNNYSIAIGADAYAGGTGTAIGYGTRAPYYGVAIGKGQQPDHFFTLSGAMALGKRSMAFGGYVESNGLDSVAIGNYAKVQHSNAVVICANNEGPSRSSGDGTITLSVTNGLHGVYVGTNTMRTASLHDLVAAESERAITDAVPEWARENAPPSYDADDVGAAPASLVQDVDDLRTESSLVYRLYSGSNVVCEVTNYNSQAHEPTMRLMQLNESNEYVTVWSETNGLARTLRAANDYADKAIADRAAPRAWSATTSGLGAEAPPNTTWISTPTTVIAGGFEYAKFVDTYGEVWVLTSNGMAAEFNPDTNAYFRITADDGTPVFSIEKSDAQLVGANAAGITVGETTITIPVPVVSSTAPTMYWRYSLSSGDWADETAVNPSYMAVDWTGGPGSWVCTISFDGTRPSLMFFKFSFLQEGGVVIRNNSPTDLSNGIIINKHLYLPFESGNNIIWTRQQ